MKPVGKLIRKSAQVRRSYKTKEDFLRWLREKDARQKRLGQEEITQADRANSQALMVWADDGGATGQFNPLAKRLNKI
jgi:hypothetical protein